FDGAGSMAIGSLAVSPDGTKLAFQRASSVAGPDLPAGSRLWIKSLSGGKPFPVPGDAYQDAPAWSPTGDWIAFLTRQREGLHLVKAPVGGRASPIVLMASGIPPFVTRPQWSPDGDWILCETDQGLTMIAADGSGRTRGIADPGWFAYAWDTDGRAIYGLRPTDEEHPIMLVTVNAGPGAQRIINANLGTIPQALQPIRGFSRLKNGGFVTSIAHVRSDIYLLEGLAFPAKWWQHFWPFARPMAQ